VGNAFAPIWDASSRLGGGLDILPLFSPPLVLSRSPGQHTHLHPPHIRNSFAAVWPHLPPSRRRFRSLASFFPLVPSESAPGAHLSPSHF